jgi:hypothetical protein
MRGRAVGELRDQERSDWAREGVEDAGSAVGDDFGDSATLVCTNGVLKLKHELICLTCGSAEKSSCRSKGPDASHLCCIPEAHHPRS